METVPDLIEAVRATGGHSMNSSWRIAFVAFAVSTAAGPAPGKTERKIALQQALCARLYLQEQVPPRTIHWATIEATRIFRAAGINIAWQQPLVEAPEDQGLDMSSAAPRSLDERHYLVVRITQRTPATVFPGALGFALPFSHSGAHVLIFYDRIDALARSMSSASYVILGHAIAHEIGHVLLGLAKHSSSGLMQARWSQANWRLASAGLLAVTPEQAERMREGLLKFRAPQKKSELLY
jgi:hypothetical protein